MLSSVAVLAAVAALVIALSSPLFRVLGFEYSALMALALSLVCGIAAIKRQRTQGTASTKARAAIVESVALAFVPLVISVISLPFIPNCAFWDGLLFYIEVAYPSAILGGLFGISCSWVVKRPRNAALLFTFFWVATLFLSLLPGYYNPQLFTYGWQYGFFPGLVWDESLQLTNAYLAARCEHVLLAALLLSLASLWQRGNGTDGPSATNGSGRAYWSYVTLLLACAAVLFVMQDKLGITVSHDVLQKQLSGSKSIVPNCTIYYAPNSLTKDEIDKIDRDVRWYLHDIERRFALSLNHPPIRIYIYPTNDAMFALIGTREASIAKPWLGEVHIAKNNLESLKHELTHVLLREKGVFPFYASWSTGITEGAAMSVEPEYDGIYTLDEHAARILQLHYASGVTPIMSFTGFAANASQKSYVLAGSFSRYLLGKYGSAPFDRVYASLNWEKEYGKPLDSLETEWKRWLQPMMTPMDAGDSERFRYYYDRASIIYNPCLRRIGKLEREGAEAYAHNEWQDALSYYHAAIAEGAGISALVGAERALLRMSDWRGAMTILDTTRTASIRKQIAALDFQRADLHVIARDTALADSLYSHTEYLKLGGDRFLLAYASHVLMHARPDSLWKNYLENAFRNKKWNKSLNDSWLRAMAAYYAHASISDTTLASFAIAILRFDNFVRAGQLLEAANLEPEIDPRSRLAENDSLALSIFERNQSELRPGPSGAEWCPIKYRRAAKEAADEINAEWQFLQSNLAPRGRGTNP
jgi:hypothetical protein